MSDQPDPVELWVSVGYFASDGVTGTRRMVRTTTYELPAGALLDAIEVRSAGGLLARIPFRLEDEFGEDDAEDDEPWSVDDLCDVCGHPYGEHSVGPTIGGGCLHDADGDGCEASCRVEQPAPVRG